MLTANDSLEFVLAQVDRLQNGEKAHERAAYKAMMNLTQRWAEPTQSFIDNDLEMAQRIGQDLADLQRHIADIQHAFIKVLFGSDSA
jgi:hypothetical protein